MVELMVVYVGRDVCGGRWADLVVRGFVLNVPICNRTEDLPSARLGGSFHGSLQYAYIPIEPQRNTSEP
jgi:hypothetical protein